MDQEYHMESKKKMLLPLIIILSVFLVVLSISGIVDISNKIKEGKYIGQDMETRNSIIISETGEVYAKPDLVVMSFSVVNEAKTISDAMDENTNRMNSVIKAIKDQGVEDKDLKTTSFKINPRYEYADGNYSKRTLVAYEITQQLQVKIRDLGKTGIIIERATSSGANQVGSLNFIVENEEEFKKQARTEAIEKAKTRAEELASQLDVKLGKIISFNENFFIPYYGAEFAMVDMIAGGVGGAPDIQTGENKITVSISVTYEIY